MKLCDISGDTNLTMQKASWQEIRVIIIHIPRRRGQEEDTLLAWPYNPWWPTTRSPLHLLLSAWEQERNPPIKGSHTLKCPIGLSNNDTPMSQQAESERRSPPIGDLHALECPIGLSNNDTPMSQQAESERRSPPIGDLRTLECPIGLSNNDTPMSQQVESERWSPQIGDLHTIKRPIGPLMWRWERRESPPNWEVMHPRKPNWPLTQRERKESPPNWEVMHSRKARLALSCGGESEGRAPPIGRSCTLESQIGLSHNESARRAPPIGRSCTRKRPNWPSHVSVIQRYLLLKSR